MLESDDDDDDDDNNNNDVDLYERILLILRKQINCCKLKLLSFSLKKTNIDYGKIMVQLQISGIEEAAEQHNPKISGKLKIWNLVIPSR